MKRCSRCGVILAVVCLSVLCSSGVVKEGQAASERSAGKPAEKPGVSRLYEFDTRDLLDEAEAGNAEAQYWLGSRYYSGSYGLKQNYTIAVEWFEKAVKADNARAQALLGHMYVTACGVSSDFEKGLELVHAAAAQTNSTALNYLGTYYEMGRGGLRSDRFEAMDWYIKAAAKRHSAAKKSLSKLRKEADAYRLGVATNKWWELSLSETLDLAEKGDVEAQRNLGVRYKGYGGTPVDFEKAEHWLELAAAQTNLSAHYSLALIYASSTNVQPEKAFYHCSIAAEGGKSSAQRTMGYYYRDGFGVEPDRVKALFWYEKARVSGDSSATSKIYYLLKGEAETVSRSEKSISAKKYNPPDVKLTILDAQGKQSDVKLVGYDPVNKRVLIDPPFGATNSLPLCAFKGSSQLVVQNEMAHEAFKKLSVRIRAAQLTKNECEKAGKIFGRRGSSTYDYDGVSYRLEFRNLSAVRLKNLKVSCIFYYEKESFVPNMYGEGTPRERLQNEGHSFTIRSLDSGAESLRDIPSYILESYRTESGVYYRDGSPTMVKSDPVGLWVRVTWVAENGAKVYRDFYENSSVRKLVE